MSTTPVGITKLKGSKDYPVWATRAEAFLITKEYINSLDDIIREVKAPAENAQQALYTPPVYQAIRPNAEDEAAKKKDKRGLLSLYFLLKD